MGRPKITQEAFEERIRNKFTEESFYIEKYTSIGEPLTIRCLHCNNIINVKVANNFLAPNKVWGCVNCKGLHIERARQINNLLKDYYLLDDTQVRDTHKIYTIKCKDCAHIRSSSLRNLISYPKCGCKTGTFRRSHDEFVKELNKRKNNEYEVLSEFKGMISKIKVRHKQCNFIWNVRPNDLFNGANCPHCGKKESLGARIISKHLMELGLLFEKEKLVPGSKLRFDFYLVYKNQKYAIEYNGEQHYVFTPYFHKTQQAFKTQKERDKRKKKLSFKNNIQLIVIPYTKNKDEIIQILNNYFT